MADIKFAQKHGVVLSNNRIACLSTVLFCVDLYLQLPTVRYIRCGRHLRKDF